jgi:MoxR-like ATPase
MTTLAALDTVVGEINLESSTRSRPNAADLANAIVANVETVVRGRRQAVEQTTIGLLAGGHVLIEDSPGNGKTTLARALANSVGASFRRIQGTPDLLPSDLTGSTIWSQDTHSFTFIPGPIFTNLLLVDELNRATPRAQSALLEAMEESTVTVDGVSHKLPAPFFVIATQNPSDQHGTYALPEGQLDRFAIAVTLGPNDAAIERQVLREQLLRPTVDDVRPVVTVDELRWLQHEVRRTFVCDTVLDFALSIVRATREDPRVQTGASSRAALSMVRCCQARALLARRDFVTPDDVKAVAPAVLTHRLVVGLDRGLHGATSEAALAAILAATPVPPIAGG